MREEQSLEVEVGEVGMIEQHLLPPSNAKNDDVYRTIKTLLGSLFPPSNPLFSVDDPLPMRCKLIVRMS